MTLLVGADHSDLEPARAFLGAFSDRIFLFGGVGSGTARAPERLVDLSEMINVAQDDGKGVLVARRSFDFAGKVSAEEAAPRGERQITGRREPAILLECDLECPCCLRDCVTVASTTAF